MTLQRLDLNWSECEVKLHANTPNSFQIEIFVRMKIQSDPSGNRRKMSTGDVGSPQRGGGEAAKRLAVRQLKRYASWVQTVEEFKALGNQALGFSRCELHLASAQRLKPNAWIFRQSESREENNTVIQSSALNCAITAAYCRNVVWQANLYRRNPKTRK